MRVRIHRFLSILGHFLANLSWRRWLRRKGALVRVMMGPGQERARDAADSDAGLPPFRRHPGQPEGKRESGEGGRPVLCSNGHQPADARGAADLRKSGEVVM